MEGPLSELQRFREEEDKDKDKGGGRGRRRGKRERKRKEKKREKREKGRGERKGPHAVSCALDGRYVSSVSVVDTDTGHTYVSQRIYTSSPYSVLPL